MRNKDCHNTFREAQRLRTQYPLSHGRYKLEECRYRLQRCRDEIGRIRQYLNHEADGYELLHCTSGDKYIWLKHLPGHVAYRLGYEVLPGLLALRADGASSSAISASYPHIENQCLTLLDSLESARIAIWKNIEIEYRQMRQGGSLIEPLLERAIRLSSYALGVLR